MRCIYSPAAAEKVDLHSLNNRLIQVEALLTLITSGKNPPPFQSSYPLASPHRPQITPGSASSMISISIQDLNNIWLAHCHLPQSTINVKLEPFLDLLPSSIHTNLPPQSIYSSHKKPHPTPELLALLPDPSTRTKLLHRARTAYPELAVFIPWDHVLDLSADPEEVQEREREREKQREKEKKAMLARAVFYGIRGESSSSQDQTQEFAPALPLFMVLCYLLALGARTTEESVDKTFLYALAGQAMDVWQAYRPSYYECPPETNSQLHLAQDELADAQREADDVDFVLASLMQVVCLVRGAKTGSGMKAVFPLVCVLSCAWYRG
jgi:hypothetical protein